jgi:hypothetical protein
VLTLSCSKPENPQPEAIMQKPVQRTTKLKTVTWKSQSNNSKATAPEFQIIGNYSEGLARARINYYWGYIDKTGKIIISRQISVAGSLSKGLAPVRFEGEDELKYIGKSGEITYTPEFDTTLVKPSFSPKDTYQSGERLNVLSRADLELKAFPHPTAKTLGAVSYGEQISIEEDGNEKVAFEMEEIPEYWVLVKYGNTRGYVVDGFLSKLPAPAEDCDESDFKATLSIKIYDSGAVLEEAKWCEGWKTALRIPHITVRDALLIAKLCYGELLKDQTFSGDTERFFGG